MHIWSRADYGSPDSVKHLDWLRFPTAFLLQAACMQSAAAILQATAGYHVVKTALLAVHCAGMLQPKLVATRSINLHY